MNEGYILSASEGVSLTISAKERDLGDFTVRRFLPHDMQRKVGPFVFFDHMGPAGFAPGQGIDIRPHPHVSLATITECYLDWNFVASTRNRIEQARDAWRNGRFPIIPDDAQE